MPQIGSYDKKVAFPFYKKKGLKNIFSEFYTDPAQSAKSYHKLTELKSPNSVKLNPLYFTKKKIYPKNHGFTAKTPRFKQSNLFRNKVGPGAYNSDVETLEERAKSIKVRIKKFSFENKYIRNALGRTTDRFGDKMKSQSVKNFIRNRNLIDDMRSFQKVGGVKDWEETSNVGPYDSGCYDNGSYNYFQKVERKSISGGKKKVSQSHRILRKSATAKGKYQRVNSARKRKGGKKSQKKVKIEVKKGMEKAAEEGITGWKGASDAKKEDSMVIMEVEEVIKGPETGNGGNELETKIEHNQPGVTLATKEEAA